MEDEIRFIGDMQRLELKPGDSLVVKAMGIISRDTAERIESMLSKKFPGVPIVVLDAGLEIGVLGKGE